MKKTGFFTGSFVGCDCSWAGSALSSGKVLARLKESTTGSGWIIVEDVDTADGGCDGSYDGLRNMVGGSFTVGGCDGSERG